MTAKPATVRSGARLAGGAAAIVAAVVWGQAQGNPPQTQAPTFRGNTDVVIVDVSVRKGGTQVTGLTAADFELRDNGVKQDVERVDAAAVPIDLSIVVDVSGNPDRPWVNLPTPAKVAADLDEQVRKLTRLLRAGDRVRLFALDTYVQQLWALQPAAAPPPVRHVDFDGQSSLYDTLTTVLLQPVETTRRHVVVAATRGADTVSVITAASLRTMAEHSDAQLHLVMLEVAADAEASVRHFQCVSMSLCRPTYRFWMPARRRLFMASAIQNGSSSGAVVTPPHTLYPDGLQLKVGAEATGGGLYQGEGLGEPTLFSTFEKAFENFRQSYVLRYSPRGVTREGWHQITVTVPKEKSATIRARNGYSVDVSTPPAPPVPPPAANALLRTLPELTRAFEMGAYDSVTRSLRQITDPLRLIGDFDEAGNPWPATPRREATMALEIAETGLFSARAEARDAAQKLLARFALLVRQPIAADPFERAWFLAELSVLQGTIRPSVARPLVERALARFPNEPRFLLARAIVTDQFWRSTTRAGGGEGSTAEPSANQVSDVIAQYEAAAEYPDTAAEARIRLGWFLMRTGKTQEALGKLIDAASVATADPALRYLRQLFTGHALVSLGRVDEAMAAYRDATATVPGAQAARVALMNGLLAKGDRAEAAVVAEQIQTAPMVVDPWWMYWQGDYRRYPQALAALRGFIR